MSYENTSGRGVLAHYGARNTANEYGGTHSKGGAVKEATWTFDYDDLPDAGATNLQLSIPAYAKIISSRFEVLVGFTSTSTTSDLDVGLQESDGTEIDNNGLHAAAQLTQTAIATRGLFYLGAGALVGVSTGAAAGELVVTPTADDLLTGRARVVVEYVLEGSGGA